MSAELGSPALPDGRRSRDSPGGASRAIRVLLAELTRQRSAIVRLALWSGVQALPALMSGWTVSVAVDRGFADGRPWTGVAWLALLGLAYLASAAGTRRAFPHLGVVVEGVRDVLVRRVVAGTLRRAVRARGIPDVAGVARLTQQIESVRSVLADLLMVALRFTVTLIAVLAGLASLGLPVLGLVAAPLAISLAVFAVLVRAQARRQRDVVLTQEKVATATVPILSAIRDITAFGVSRYALSLGETVFERNRVATVATARVSALRVLIVTGGAQVPVLLVFMLGHWLREHGTTVGGLVGAITYLTMSLDPILWSFTGVFSGSGLRLLVTLQRLAETASVPHSVSAADGQVPAACDIDMDSVTFSYGLGSAPVLKDLDLGISQGDHICIIGASGIGKSTLAMLIAGLESPQHGSVLIGGIPISEISQNQRARLITLIPQEAYVFAGTLRENLVYLRPETSDAELEQAVWLLGGRPLTERIGGFAAEVVPEELSAGEKQLIALVRAYVSPAKVVILDEATSHLEPAVEAVIEHAFMNRSGTLIVIAHRISSALRAPRILLLDGDNVCLGTHQELLNFSSLYADLVGVWRENDQPVPDQEPRLAEPKRS